MYKVIGIDEAGRGPVIGSMFIGFSIIILDEGLKSLNDYQDELVRMGVKDSKLLTPKKRGEIYNKLSDMMDLKYVQLIPSYIDENNFSGGKLNELEISAIIKILEQERPNLVILDALTSKPEKFGDELLKRLSFECKIISENKADVKYSIVGAASIVAKELREKELKEIRENIKIDCGSGYPGDPKTKEFLEKNWDNKEFDFIFRKSWATYKNVVEKHRPKKSLLDY